MDRCLAPDSDWGGVGCDNMTVMIVAIKGTRTKVEWYNWIAERVEKGEPYPTPKSVIDPFSQAPRGGLSGPIGAEARENEQEEQQEDRVESVSTEAEPLPSIAPPEAE